MCEKINCLDRVRKKKINGTPNMYDIRTELDTDTHWDMGQEYLAWTRDTGHCWDNELGDNIGVSFMDNIIY